jgi:hypothetical protein
LFLGSILTFVLGVTNTIAWGVGYHKGKSGADRWYADHDPETVCLYGPSSDLKCTMVSKDKDTIQEMSVHNDRYAEGLWILNTTDPLVAGTIYSIDLCHTEPSRIRSCTRLYFMYDGTRWSYLDLEARHQMLDWQLYGETGTTFEYPGLPKRGSRRRREK